MGQENEVKTIISAEDKSSSVIAKIGGLMAATFSVAAVMAFGKAAVESSTAQEDAEIKLAQALGKHSQALHNQAAALQRTTKFADESIIAAQASLAMFSKDEAQLKRLTKATLDFAAAKGIDLVSAADIVGKSFGGQISMLGRYGVATEGAAGSTERLNSILDGLGARFGGQAEAQGRTFSGVLTIVKNSADDMMETFGNVITRNPAVIMAMKMLSGVFEDLGNWVQKNQVWLMELTQTGIVWLIRGIGYLSDAVDASVVVWDAFKVGVNAIIYGIGTALLGLLTPLNWVMDKLVEFGYLDANPLKGLTDAFAQFKASSKDVLDSSIADLGTSIAGYGELGAKIQGTADVLETVKIKATEVKDAIAAIVPIVLPDPPPDDLFLGPTEQAIAYGMTISDMWYHIGLASSNSTQVQKANIELLNRATQMGANIRNAANKSMQTELLRLVETQKFSVGEIGKALAQAVKMELTAVAAQAAIRALYFFAMGLAASTVWGAATLGPASNWYASAAKMALIAGVSLAGAAAVNAVSGGGSTEKTDQDIPGAPPSDPARTTGPSLPTTPAGNQIGAVTVNIYNPLSTQNWDEVIELDIVPAIQRAQARGVT